MLTSMAASGNKINHTSVDDNTKPFARMGRKAYWVSKRQPGCRNAKLKGIGIRFFYFHPILGM
jgi:hypothetical protein